MMLLVVALVLTSFGTASAECAWLVWLQLTDAPKGQSPRSGEWEILQAVPSRDLCEQIIRVKTKDQPRNLAQTNMVQLKDGDSGVTFIRYLCVPDTIDPRGRK
jgi:hypothetical protein